MTYRNKVQVAVRIDRIGAFYYVFADEQFLGGFHDRPSALRLRSAVIDAVCAKARA